LHTLWRLNTKIPDIKQNCEEERDVHCEEEIRDRDIILKDRNKLYIDTKRKALKSELSVGDNVLVRFCLSTSPFAAGCNGVVFLCFTSLSFTYCSNTLDVNCGPLSDLIVYGSPCRENIFSNESIILSLF
jgi:hypothetical protein